MRARFQVVGGPAAGSQLLIEKLPALLGRAASADLVLDDPWVSRCHCELCEDQGQLVVRDRGSLHGTLLNGRAVREAVIQRGDRLGVGLTTLVASYVPAKSRSVSR